MRRWLIPLLLLPAAPAYGQVNDAQTVITSPGADSASVTVYRDPDRNDGEIDARFPQGFALISEKRRLSLPAGDSTIRFEGVADGMIAVSAVVTGLPGGVVQKNRDARLLSPAALVDGTLGNRVHLRRTNRQSGVVTEQDAVIRSTADNALVLETVEGVEGLRCSGLPEGLSYDGLPPGLSAKPTLSVETRIAQAVTVEATLTYLATGFDWGANYVARIGADGRTLDLFAWLTVANGDEGNFPDARLLAVAGRLNRESDYGDLLDAAPSPELSLQCWRFEGYAARDDRPPPPPPPAPSLMAAPMAVGSVGLEEIIVSARRVAEQEDLGDLKLYRVPMAVDINPHMQKQVALLDQHGIVFESYYAVRLSADDEEEEPRPLVRMIRFLNARQNGAGVPMPSGNISIFESAQGESLLLAQGPVRDRAVGEQVKLEAGLSPSVRVSRQSGEGDSRRLILTNAMDRPAPVELELQADDAVKLSSPSHRLLRRDGLWLWKVTVPANGTVQLDYRLRAR